jgi:hypothetical protein
MEGSSPSRATGQGFVVLDSAREITDDPELATLELKKFVGIPVATRIRNWLIDQPDRKMLPIDFTGVRAMNLSVAEELGPTLMQTINNDVSFSHKYPVFIIAAPEPLYTFARSFAQLNWNGLARVRNLTEATAFASPILSRGAETFVVLGLLSDQMMRILALAEKRAQQGLPLTSETLQELSFLTGTQLSARSKRLTELYARRLLAFVDNPEKPKERLFSPVWRMDE